MSQQTSLELRLRHGQTLRQMQRLIMSPQMQQAIALLQMPLMELADRVDEELVQNPILENGDEEEQSSDIEDFNAIEEVAETPAESELNFDADNFEILKRLDEELVDHFEQSGGSKISRSSDEEKIKAFIENSICSRVSLFEHLMNQARETFEEPGELMAAEALIGNFDISGFLNLPLGEVAVLSGISENDLRGVLEKIQQFEPWGIGARSLQESLLIQLRNSEKKETLAYQLVEDNFEDLLHNRIPQIQKKLGCKSADIARAIREDISKLDLHPGSGFSDNPVQLAIPDITIFMEDEKFRVIVNDDSMPSLRLNRRYMRYLEDPEVPPEAKEFIKQKIMSAKWFLRNLHQRNDTLEKIGLYLIKYQADFFSRPNGKLQPLTMKTLAEELSVNESTIARAVSGKYINCPRGLLPLRSFFTNAYVTDRGDDISSKTVKEAIADLVDSENKQRPLSDEAISASLKAKGIICARRTVAKYRGVLNLGNAHQRKIFT